MFAANTTVKNRIGQRIGKLVVVKRAPSKPERDAIRACWWCMCDCGNSIIVMGASLNKGAQGKGGTRSCGCLMREKPLKHGRTNTKVYKSWHMMLQRCTNPKNSAYHRYGGRGITVCEEWRDFRNFYADMGDPAPGLTIDRIDNSVGYRKDNCRWVTMAEQGNNRCSNVFLTYLGKRQTMSQWAAELGIKRQCLLSRLNSGWTLERTLTTPKGKTFRS